MTIEQIKEILNSNFADEADRAYWVKKLHDLEIKEKTAAENEKYFNEMGVYDR